MPPSLADQTEEVRRRSERLIGLTLDDARAQSFLAWFMNLQILPAGKTGRRWSSVATHDAEIEGVSMVRLERSASWVDDGRSDGWTIACALEVGSNSDGALAVGLLGWSGDAHSNRAAIVQTVDVDGGRDV